MTIQAQVFELQQQLLVLKQTAAPKLQIQQIQQQLDQLLHRAEGIVDA